ncbi:hypothetical protein HPP92_010833 [Vanilla planifolia]|uniref:Uncharacterized protein n=1 Tax=Vanilla planifolia TaxID=51239 RepID=A0A835QUL3_VANPL|nr:hypothetical protein HPP92_010833 [Vanilla planifolia]
MSTSADSQPSLSECSSSFETNGNDDTNPFIGSFSSTDNGRNRRRAREFPSSTRLTRLSLVTSLPRLLRMWSRLWRRPAEHSAETVVGNGLGHPVPFDPNTSALLPPSLVSDESEQAPSINLIHGLVLYQLWYADLPEEMQIKGLDVQTSLDAHGMSSVDLCQESDKGESSNGHDAIDVEKSKGSSRCSSESSVGNEKLSTEQKNVIHRKKSGQPSHSQGFHAFQFFEDDELMGHPSDQDNVFDSSIYLAPGLDKILLPIHLKLLVEDPVQSVLLYRKLANENYREAVKHLHLALHSTPPLLAALLPLIQLLLLGDRVHEAIMELDYSCSVLDSALPFRLKARLLQCFHRDQITLISSCYQNALVRDPTCNYSMERLIKIHKSGNYSTLRLVEMLAMHLDAVDGKCGIWEELASCFLQLQRAMPSDYEDRVSTNVEAVKDISSCYRIPRIFIDGEAVDSWMIRCRWWASRHFCKRILLFEIQSGEQMLFTIQGRMRSSFVWSKLRIRLCCCQ